jgi:hypothetical protein
MAFINDMGVENVRVFSDKGKRGEAVTLNQKIHPFITKILRKDMIEKIKKLAFIRRAYHIVLMLASKVKVTPDPEHIKLTEEQVRKISETLDLDKNYLIDNFNLDAEKLKKYKY